ncbi:uncharacterized protein LOC131536114 [Onychostoma macrolepis]|uniref:uncharacterized protein LOC131536114 n=1 Tax=Onychostoma macrolepis TaxID=369639 RepID=UPI00272C7B32|nr:uncharacterized protein LOC131536114 [Onychostoma macrolepis]
MHIINVTCAEIQTPAGFVYVILPVLLNHTNNPDCEQSWYLQDGRLIADPANPQALIDPVISVSSDRLVTSHCVNLNHEIICDSPDGLHFSRVTAFRAKNETAATPNSNLQNEVTPDLQHSDQFWWLLAFFVIVLFIIFLICLMKRKRIFRCFQKFIFQRDDDDDDSENRDPEAAVQMKFRSDAPDSLNQSESEQLNGSLSRG